MATSANALYVLRLVLGGVRRRAFVPARTRTFSDSSSMPGHAQPQSFLEADDGEYAAADEFLPDRVATEAAPVPWPTVFEHGARRPRQAQPCDIVARLVASEKFGSARKVVDELTALHTPVQHRKIYLKPALACLEPTDEGRRGFLFWMELYPARGATPNHSVLRKEWAPIVHRVLAENIDNPAFLIEFFELSGRKGLLNVVLPIFVAPLASVLPPHQSEEAVSRAIAAYRATCRPKSDSKVGRNLASLTDIQTELWWNKYIRALAIVEHHEPAAALLHSPPSGVRFQSWARAMVLGEDMSKQQRADAARSQGSQGGPRRDGDLWQLIDNPAPGRENRELAKHLERVLDRTQNDLPHVGTLADTQRLLLRLRPELLGALERWFTEPSRDSLVEDDGTSIRHQWWAHAEVLRHARDGDHVEAVRTFRRHFLWVGLPPTNVGTGEIEKRPRRLPNKRIVCSILPSILALLSPAERATYRKAFYASFRSLAPTLWPNQFTHLAFVRIEAYTGGPTAATEAMQNIVEAGLNPGLPAWTALLLSMMGRGDTEAALHLLNSMERRAPLTETRRMPPPTGRTYAGLVRVAAKHGHISVAAALLRRYQKHGESGGELGSLEAFFGNVKRRSRTPEELAEEKRSQAAVLRELDRLDGDDLKSRIQVLFERKRGHGNKANEVEQQGEYTSSEGVKQNVMEEKVAEHAVLVEHREEKKSSAYA
ncbi:uncharacterized protein CcaverHIS019_0411130 [Cutaneotrichosporon cavernicola]|uniref:Uncharacterized protein n=1 Tax=Cutaneotrichosporon cavernicola TaxID=279322 RepID=A0AA48L5I2_9TREE|nr:uncharacterized protein CcaverHIS019_0411130 [Cutaneotrichosporon cavernicola]BEI92293.1 hypothetical protein CcaverHIS019_0411130 [Cutaneotrichosporon cavernicola]